MSKHRRDAHGQTQTGDEEVWESGSTNANIADEINDRCPPDNPPDEAMEESTYQQNSNYLPTQYILHE
ncbi:unnamed protein product [Schistocephalus solidus]|uniref:Uncharacterized protein n=1 Tax=Schistocephalus solidus TaxID=70667 RepID=A0A183SYR9_SCHSO|nr:unnamed protein product [Schistocephalus solidus]